jgi:hypothetical protein
MSATCEMHMQISLEQYVCQYFVFHVAQLLIFFSLFTAQELHLAHYCIKFVELQVFVLLVITTTTLLNFHVKYARMLLDINIVKLCIYSVSFTTLHWKHPIT